jgi:UPF0271 protein
MLLNCDLGESYGSWTLGQDAKAMPHIDQANIACGFHAGDPLVMQHTLALAKQHKVMVGAHPAYPDLVGFGRRSMNCSEQEIIAFMHYQIAAMEGMAACQGLTLSYVKPHGALYNDMMVNGHIRSAVMQAISDCPQTLAFMLQATPSAEQHKQEAAAFGLQLIFEVFADRCYADNGALLSRSLPGAVHSREKMLEQVAQLSNEGSITTISGHKLELQADSICVHGDNSEGVAAIREIRHLLSKR